MREKLFRWIANSSLKKKMFFPVLLTIIVFSMASLIGMQIVSNTSDRLLYQSTATAMAFSATDISKNMDSVAKLTDMMIADNAIQENLMVLKYSEDALLQGKAYQRLYSDVQSYYQQFKQDHLSYIDLFSDNDEYKIQSYAFTTGKQLDDGVRNDLIKTALEANGKIVTVTKYCGLYGLFVVRQIRQSQALSLKNLGVMVICINPGDMVRAATDNGDSYKDSLYLLFSKDGPVSSSEGLAPDMIQKVQEQVDKPYKVVSVGSKKYFAVRNSLSGYDWNFFNLVEYNNIYRSIQFSRWLFIVIIVVCILLSIFLSDILINPLMGDFNYLVIKMKTFGNSNTKLVDVGHDYRDRTDEFGVLHRVFDKMANQIRTLIRVNYSNEILRKDAQLKALEMQMNPHFLYNTLESVNWRAKAIGEKQISRMVESLGRLLRITLNARAEDFTLGQELELVQSYLTIQQIRYENRLSCRWLVDDRLLDAHIPKLTLQPLLENAIRYGLEESMDVCRIDITVRKAEEDMEIIVCNSGSNFEDALLEKLKRSEVQPGGLGIGLLNIQNRIQMTFGKKYGIALSNEDENAVVRLTIPYRPIRKE